MNLFRSEEHIARWLGGRAPGETVPAAQLREAGIAWFHDRLDPGWRPHTREQNQELLDGVGLRGPFWRLP
jgi:hypothetical protein